MKRVVFFALVLLLTVIAIRSPMGAFAAPRASLPVSVNDSGFTIANEIEGGLVTVEFTNVGQAPHLPGIARLKDGESPESIAAAGENALTLVEDAVAPGILMPSTSGSVIANLKPGIWLVTDAIDPTVPPTFVTVVAGDGDGTTVPADAPAIGMHNFAFTGIPTTVNAGKTTWKLENKGTQFHEVILYQVEEGVTPQEFLASFDGQSPPAGIPFGAGVTTPGSTIWKEFTLTPGNYLAVCLVPDDESGAPHAQLGMMTAFTVTDAPATMPQTGSATPWYLTWLGWGAVTLMVAVTLRAFIVRTTPR
jgi:hypothetical protein